MNERHSLLDRAVDPSSLARNTRLVAETLACTLYDLPEDKRFSSESYNCRPPVIGVPLGRAYRSCTAEERSLAGPADRSGDFQRHRWPLAQTLSDQLRDLFGRLDTVVKHSGQLDEAMQVAVVAF